MGKAARLNVIRDEQQMIDLSREKIGKANMTGKNAKLGSGERRSFLDVGNGRDIALGNIDKTFWLRSRRAWLGYPSS